MSSKNKTYEIYFFLEKNIFIQQRVLSTARLDHGGINVFLCSHSDNFHRSLRRQNSTAVPIRSCSKFQSPEFTKF